MRISAAGIKKARRDAGLCGLVSICEGGLTLRELEATAGAGLAVLLAFDLPGVACQEALLAENILEVGVIADEGAGDAEADGLGLPHDAAARDADEDFELVVGVEGSARDVGGEIQRLDGVIITDSNLTNQSSTRPRCRRKRRCQSYEDRLRRCVYIPH